MPSHSTRSVSPDRVYELKYVRSYGPGYAVGGCRKHPSKRHTRSAQGVRHYELK